MLRSIGGAVSATRRVAVTAVLLVVTASSGGVGQAATADFAPVTIDNCGRTATYEKPPERAVPLDQNVTELMLALGLEDRIVGFTRQHFTPDSLVPPEYEEAYNGLKLLSELDAPSKEVVLSVEPDFMIGAFEGAFDPQRGMTRDTLEGLGIGTYLLSDQCSPQPDSASFDLLYQDVRNIARIFGVEEKGQALVDDIAAQIQNVQAKVLSLGQPPVKVFVYDSGLDAPFSVGGAGMANAVIEAAGGENVFAGVDDQFVDVSWEEAIERNPDAILIMDYSASDPPDVSAQKDTLKQRLGGNQPVTAIVEDRILALPLLGFFSSIRNADTVQAVAEFLYPDLA